MVGTPGTRLDINHNCFIVLRDPIKGALQVIVAAALERRLL